ncbi:hypothetical protein HPB47_010007 [Ixodes persulcatus]|uniref:Uncharacterized protein n=1 Tax=Ixodes persulcatus TaxID=34615 RepID=A0AC60P096_IXOPE|nr:hypothetical protein HPB47_010007 [Ixodes persulcatus]
MIHACADVVRTIAANGSKPQDPTMWLARQVMKPYVVCATVLLAAVSHNAHGGMAGTVARHATVLSENIQSPGKNASIGDPKAKSREVRVYDSMLAHVMGSSASRSHVEIRNDEGGIIRLSFFKIIITFMLFLTMLMIASGITVSAATTWLVGSVLIFPGLLLLCVTAVVAFSILSGRPAHLYADTEEPNFPGVEYAKLPQDIDASVEQLLKTAVGGASAARPGGPPPKHKKAQPNVSFQE